MEEPQQPEPLIIPFSMLAELKEFLDPVGKGTDADIDQMQYWLNQNAGERCKINVYWCATGHDTVTIDRFSHGHKKTIRCPFCKEESRSMHYMVDQNLAPTAEFYRPKDVLAFPKQQQEALRRGAPAFKAILTSEPTRMSTSLLSKLNKANKA